MLVKLYLDDTADADLAEVIHAMPRGERSSRLKSLLRLAVVITSMARASVVTTRVEIGDPLVAQADEAAAYTQKEITILNADSDGSG